MIVICEECGKKYQVDPTKIKSQMAMGKCHACGNRIMVTKPDENPEEPNLSPLTIEEPPEAILSSGGNRTQGEEQKTQRMKAVKLAGTKGRRMGLKTKIFILFFFIPIILIVSAGLLYMGQLKNLSVLISDESSKVVTDLAAQIIGEKARAVADQVVLYLNSHPNLNREQFSSNEEFRNVAVQKVGKTGYSALYAVPDAGGVWRTWAHANNNIVGIDMASLEKPMGNNFAGFWKIFSKPKDGKESEGYYTWQEKDGSFREKYMVCTPVKGTPFVIAATTYLDEFTMPITQLENRAREMTTNTRNVVFGILGATLLLIGLIVALYGQRLTSNIKSLTDLAERISVGEMDAEINVDSRDELGDLAQAISRMQDSIRLSIERLRRRRDRRAA